MTDPELLGYVGPFAAFLLALAYLVFRDWRNGKRSNGADCRKAAEDYRKAAEEFRQAAQGLNVVHEDLREMIRKQDQSNNKLSEIFGMLTAGRVH